MGNIGFVALRDLGLALRDELNITTFIETGTYKGETTVWASENFKRVTTIESHRPYFDSVATMKLPNVRCIFGDSRVALKIAVSRLRKPALIWLDAHWCGSYRDSLDTSGECPLIDELKALQRCKTRHLILIDDARLFIEPPPLPHDPGQWPALNQIRELLPDGYQMTIWNDVIIAVPAEIMPIVNRFTQDNKMRVIVLTSNHYVHCLPPFAYLFNKFWGKDQAVKVVRYDVRPPKLPDNFTNFAVGIQDKYSWSDGLIKYLTYHNNELVLLMLEDYFISSPAGKAMVKELWELMQHQPEIAKIDLSNDRLKVGHTDFNDYLIKSDDDAPFQTSVQAAIWRKGFLLRFLKTAESAWQFEKRGTKRVIKARQDGNFDGLILGCKQPPLSYINAVGGEGNNPGAWDLKKFPVWMVGELREKRLI
jgi:hypothetical protein